MKDKSKLISNGFASGDIFFNKDIQINVFNKDGDVYFDTPDHKGRIKIDQKKLYTFIKKFEKK